MRNYFSFNLNITKLLPYWIAMYVIGIGTYAIMIFSVLKTQPGNIPPLYVFALMPVIFIVLFLVYFYLIKFSIEAVEYKGKALQFKGTILGFLGTLLLGILLCFLSLFIYTPWFTRDIYRYFANHTSYDSEDMEFLGRGSELAVIYLAFFLIMIVIVGIMFKSLLAMATMGFVKQYLFRYFSYLIFTPFMYFIYRWTANIHIKTYTINWRTETWPSIGKMALEITLTFVTFFIYFPAAILKLYQYFTERTVAHNGTNQINFGFELSLKDDFLFIWKNTLLTIVTFGFYYIWAMNNVFSRIATKTYTLSNETPVEATAQTDALN